MKVRPWGWKWGGMGEQADEGQWAWSRVREEAWSLHRVSLLCPHPSASPLTQDQQLPQCLLSLLLGEVNPEALLRAQAAERRV